MARRRIRISLGLKIRILFGVALLCVIAAALLVPWYFMELLSEQGLEGPARELTLLRLNEWSRLHHKDLESAADSRSIIFDLYTREHQAEGLRGPSMIRLNRQDPTAGLDKPALRALQAFDSNPSLDIVWRKSHDEQGEAVYRCFRAVRNTKTCNDCHGQRTKPGAARFQLDELVGLVDITLPASSASGELLWWTRGAFVAGGALAGILALVVFSVIANRIILRPVRRLREVADRVARGRPDRPVASQDR